MHANQSHVFTHSHVHLAKPEQHHVFKWTGVTLQIVPPLFIFAKCFEILWHKTLWKCKSIIHRHQLIFILLRFIIAFIYFAVSCSLAAQDNKRLNSPKKIKIQKADNRNGPALSKATFKMFHSPDDDMEIKTLLMLFLNQTNNLRSSCVAHWLPRTVPKKLLQ